MATTPALEQDMKLAGTIAYDTIDGVLVEKAMATRESLLAARIIQVLGLHVDELDSGVVLGADGMLRLEPGLVRIPDVSFISWDNIPGEEMPKDAIASLAPDLAVEVLSKKNTLAEIDRKLRDYFLAGTKLAWVIDPKTRTAKVHTTAARFRELGPDGVLDGGRVLPGFKLALTDLFAATKRRKKKPR